MEAPLQAEYESPLKPTSFGLSQPTKPLSPALSTDHDEYQFSPNETCTIDSCGSTTASSSTPEEEEECLVDSQPMCFQENPFLVANRKGRGRPSAEQVLSGPPVGYGRQGKLQPWLFSKARCLSGVRRQHVVLLCFTHWILKVCREIQSFRPVNVN